MRESLEAMADCNESLRVRPGDGNALRSRGLVHLKLKEVDSALADYDAALKADSKDAFSLYGRGTAKRWKGDATGADADVEARRPAALVAQRRVSRSAVRSFIVLALVRSCFI